MPKLPKPTKKREEPPKLFPEGYYEATVVEEGGGIGKVSGKPYMKFKLKTKEGFCWLMRSTGPVPKVGQKISVMCHHIRKDDMIFVQIDWDIDAYTQVAHILSVDRELVKKIAHMLGYSG